MCLKQKYIIIHGQQQASLISRYPILKKDRDELICNLHILAVYEQNIALILTL